MQLQESVVLKGTASLTGEWMALFATPGFEDYDTVRIIAWAHVQVDGRQGFGAIVSADAVDKPDSDVGNVIFAPLHPRFMGYLEPGRILTDGDIQRRLQIIKAENVA